MILHTLIARFPSLKTGCIGFETFFKEKKIFVCCIVVWRTERASVGARGHQAGWWRETVSMQRKLFIYFSSLPPKRG